MTTFTRRAAGETMRAAHINELQVAIEEVTASGSAVATQVTALQSATSGLPALQEAVNNTTAGIANVLDYGAVGDGVTDDTVAIQEAISEGEAGVYFPQPADCYLVSASLTPLANQRWFSPAGLQYVSEGSGNLVRIAGASTFNGTIIDVDVNGFSMDGLVVTGSGNPAHTNNRGIDLTNASWCGIRRCMFDNFGAQGIRWNSGVALRLEHSFTQNCVLHTTGYSDWIGAVELYGSDPYVEYNEFSSVPIGHTYNTGYITALLAECDNGVFVGNIGELSEVGIVVTGSTNSFIGNRADLNKGEGWVISGSGNRFVGNWGHQNGQATNNTYDSFRVDSSAQANAFVGNQVTWTFVGNACKYGFSSAAAFGHTAQNTFIGNSVMTSAAATGEYNISGFEGLSYFYGYKLIAKGGLGVGNSAAATTLGTVTKKIEVFDAAGASLGFVPVYDGIS